MPNDKLKQFHTALSSSSKIEGVPTDYAVFEKTMMDKDKSKAFFDFISKNKAIEGLPSDYNKFSASLGLVEKKNPNQSPSVSSGKGSPTVGSVNDIYKSITKQPTPLGKISTSIVDQKSPTPLKPDRGISPVTKGVVSNFKPSKTEPIANAEKPLQGVDMSIENARKIQEENRVVPEPQLKEDGNVGDFLVEGITSGTANILKGLTGLIGGAADLMIDKTPDSKSYIPLSNEWLAQKIQQQGEVKEGSDAWWSTQGIRDRMMDWSNKLDTIANKESELMRSNVSLDSRKTTIDHALEGNWGDFGKSLGVDIIQQIPNLATIYLSGGSNVALGVMGATSAGSSLTEEYNKDKDINFLDMGQSLAKGVVEATFSKILNTDIKAADIIGKKLTGVIGEAVKKDGVETIKKEVVRGLSDVAKQGVKGGRENGLEEFSIATANYLIDGFDEEIFTEEKFNEYLKKAGNSIVAGVGTGGAISSIAASASITPLTTEEKIKISRYEDVLKSDKSSKEVKSIAKAEIDKIQKGVATTSNETYDKLLALPLEQRVEVANKIDKIRQLEEEKATLADVDIKDSVEARIGQLKAEVEGSINQFETIEYSSLDAIPDELKDKVSSTYTIGGQTIYRVTTPKTQEASVQSSGQSNVVQQITDSKIDTIQAVSDIEARMNNAEFIDEKDLSKATDDLYAILDEVDAMQDLDPEVKNSIIDTIERRITKIEGYELETRTTTVQPEQTTKVPIGNKVIGQTTRGSKSKNAVTGERLNNVSVTATDGTTGKILDGTMVFSDGKLDVIDRESELSKEFDSGRVEYQETITDDNGVVQSVKLVDNSTGDVFQINDPDIALDIAIQEKTKRLGEINDGVFETIYKEVTTPAKVVTEVKAKAPAITTTQNQPTISTPPITPANPPPITPTPPIPPSTPQGGNTPKTMMEKSQKMWNDVGKALEEASRESLWKKFKKVAANRKTNIDSAFSKTKEGDLAKRINENTSGVTAEADDRFNEARADIYGDKVLSYKKKLFGGVSVAAKKVVSYISPEKKAKLDQIIFHRRVIDIDSSRDRKSVKVQQEISDLQTTSQLAIGQLEAKRMAEKDVLKKAKITAEIVKKKKKLTEEVNKLKAQDKGRIKHSRGFNKEDSELAIEGIKQELGDKAFDDLNSRADKYFDYRRDMLKTMMKEGFIPKSTLDNLADAEYVERRFLQHVLSNPNDPSFSTVTSSLSKDQIKALGEGSEELSLMDTEMLLHAAYRTLESKIIWNNANKALFEEVKNNPKLGTIATRKPTPNKKSGLYELNPAPTGYKLIRSFVDGQVQGVYMPNKLANEWEDLEKISTTLDTPLKKVLGVTALKYWATLANASFAITNIPRDFFKVVKLSDTYDDNIFLAMPRHAANLTKNIALLTGQKLGIELDSFKELLGDYTKHGGKFEFLHLDGRSKNLYKSAINEKSIGKNIGGKIFDIYSSVLGTPGEISEIASRLVVFERKRDKLIEQAGGKDNITPEEMTNINYIAANASRAIIDYNKGGIGTKWLDNISPYLNAKVVGFTSDMDYIRKNPKKFAAKMAMFGAEISALAMYNLMITDDEDLENVPKYVRDNNLLLFSPLKNADGTRDYLMIPMYQGLIPLKAMFEEGTKLAYNRLMGKNKGGDYKTGERAVNAIESWAPFPVTPSSGMKLLTSVPVANAGYTYISNYDSFRDSKVTYDKGENMPVHQEGLLSGKTPRFYKVLGDAAKKDFDVNLSPARLQASIEKIITTPSTNFMIAKAYGILDAMMEGYVLPYEIDKSKYKEVNTVKGALVSKFKRTTDPNISKYEKAKEIEEVELLLKSDKFIKNHQIKSMADSGLSVEEVKSNIRKMTKDENEQNKLFKKYNSINEDNAHKNERFYNDLKEVKYFMDGMGSPEELAVAAFTKFKGMEPGSDDYKEMMSTALKMDIIKAKGRGSAPSSGLRFSRKFAQLHQESVLGTKKK